MNNISNLFTLVKMTFNPAIAREVGTDAAIILENIAFWVDTNTRNKSDRHYHNGKYWTYNTQQAFLEQFIWLSRQQLRTALRKLSDSGYIQIDSFNKLSFDKTCWYTLGEKSLGCYQPSHGLESTTPAVEVNPTIPDINPDNKPDIETPRSSGEEPKTDLFKNYMEQFNNLFNRSYRITPEKSLKFKARLKTFTYKEIILSLTNMAGDAFYKGINDRGWCATPEWHLHNDEHVERFLQKVKKNLSSAEIVGETEALDYFSEVERKQNNGN